MFYTPGFLALLWLKVGEPTGFGISVELFMLASMSAIVGGLFIGTHSDSAGADTSSRIGVWSGALVLELLAVVPLLCATPSLFHELASNKLLHSLTPGATNVALGASELIPAVAILPFMLYQLAGFGTLHFLLSKPMNWAFNIVVLGLIVGSYAANRANDFALEKGLVGVLVLLMAAMVFYGVLKLRGMQERYDRFQPEMAKKAEA